MVSSRLLPRTLRGVGGVRLIDMPGVIYPESMIHGRKGTDRASGKPYAMPPPWGISSRQAAEQLGISVRAARSMLNKHKVKYHLVAQRGSPPCMYWDKRVVSRLVAKRAPLVCKIPEKLCSAGEACVILQVSRTSLVRYVQMKLVKEYKMRHVRESGVRVESYYLRAEVRQLAARRRAAKARAEQVRLARLQQRWQKTGIR